MKKVFRWLDDSLEETLMVITLILMTVIMGIQVFSRYALGASLTWSEELTRYLFVWEGFLSVSYCTKKCISIKIEQFVAMFPRRGKAIFKLVNHTFELIFFFYLIPFAVKYLISAVESRSSSPVRIVRDERGISLSLEGLYPCGEGAGYAGGITSAAVDGVKIAELIAKKYINL